MNRIGIIGVGEIGRTIVMGLCLEEDRSPEIFLSPRGEHTTAELSSRYESVRVCADNQDVVDCSDVVIIAVRREDRHTALADLQVDEDKTLVSVTAGVANDDLRQTLATNATLIRAIPLPSIRERRSVTVTYPSHPLVESLFNDLGGALPVSDESAFDVFSTLTGTLPTHYSYLATLTSWAVGHGTLPLMTPTVTSAGSFKASDAHSTTRPARCSNLPPTMRLRMETTNAFVPCGSTRLIPKRFVGPSTISSPIFNSVRDVIRILRASPMC